MRILERQSAYTVTGFNCDVCKQFCEENEFATLSGLWGFHSNKDGTFHECHMCETCFDKVNIFIRSLGGEIREMGQHWITQGPTPNRNITVKDRRYPVVTKDYLGEEGSDYIIKKSGSQGHSTEG
jgi:hypothetical protein